MRVLDKFNRYVLLPFLPLLTRPVSFSSLSIARNGNRPKLVSMQRVCTTQSNLWCYYVALDRRLKTLQFYDFSNLSSVLEFFAYKHTFKAQADEVS